MRYKCHHCFSIYTFHKGFITIPWNSRRQSSLTTERVLSRFNATRGRHITLTKCKRAPIFVSNFHCRVITKLKHMYITVKSICHTCAWKRDKALAVCNGTSTFVRNCLCSALRGNANPLMILQTENKYTSAGTKQRQQKSTILTSDYLVPKSNRHSQHLTMWEID